MNQADIISRLKLLTGKETDQELASLLGLKKANFSARKQRDSLVGVIAEWAIKEDVNLNFLLKGIKSESIENEFLMEVEKWVKKKSKNDARFANWFEIQFENSFQEFKIWRKRNEESEGGKSRSVSSNVS